MARRRIANDRKEKRECEKEGGKEWKVRGYFWLEIHRRLSFLVVIRVWRERSGTAGRNTRNRDGRRDAGRILRSACKPISISAEIRLSEFPVASGPRGSPRFIGPGSLEFDSLPAKTGPWPTDQTKRFATPDSPVYETHALSIQRTLFQPLSSRVLFGLTSYEREGTTVVSTSPLLFDLSSARTLLALYYDMYQS